MLIRRKSSYLTAALQGCILLCITVTGHFVHERGVIVIPAVQVKEERKAWSRPVPCGKNDGLIERRYGNEWDIKTLTAKINQKCRDKK